MENGGIEKEHKSSWKFQGNKIVMAASGFTVRGALNMLRENLDPNDVRQALPLGHGDPPQFPCFRTSPTAVDAVADALRSYQFNSYSSTVGILPARK